MAYLNANIPATYAQIRKEYLYDLEKGHGELTPGLWISVRSIQAKALYFETLLTDYGALFDKLPLSAFVWKEDYDVDNQRQIMESLNTMKQQLNFSFQQDLKNELDTFNYFLS